jgi:hypothetical protein
MAFPKYLWCLHGYEYEIKSDSARTLNTAVLVRGYLCRRGIVCVLLCFNVYAVDEKRRNEKKKQLAAKFLTPSRWIKFI